MCYYKLCVQYSYIVMCIYIYIEREIDICIERDREIYVYDIYIYMIMYAIHTLIISARPALLPGRALGLRPERERERERAAKS